MALSRSLNCHQSTSKFSEPTRSRWLALGCVETFSPFYYYFALCVETSQLKFSGFRNGQRRLKKAVSKHLQNFKKTVCESRRKSVAKKNCRDCARARKVPRMSKRMILGRRHYHCANQLRLRS